MPVASIIKTKTDSSGLLAFFDVTCSRVKDGVYDVERPSDYFK
jgi:hypothetical protein